jgi:hypothetical protein
MGTFGVTLKCVACGKETKALAEGDPTGEHDIALPRGWHPVVQAAMALTETCDALCPGCRRAKK